MASIVRNLVEISGIADNMPKTVSVFKQLTVSETLELPEEKPDIEQIIKVIAQVEITSTRVIRTPVGQSMEGQKLTGFKLIVEGEIIQKFEFVADECSQAVHAAHFEIPFSTFIILPAAYCIGTPVPVTAYIEDIFVELIGKRTIFKNITILLDAFS